MTPEQAASIVCEMMEAGISFEDSVRQLWRMEGVS